MRRSLLLTAIVLVALGLAAVRAIPRHDAAADHGDYEVWAIDQADSTNDGGGRLYIYQGRDLTASGTVTPRPEVIDLGGAARTLCMEQTGSAPRRPHMLFFNAQHSHMVLAFVATGHVLFMDTESRRPLACIDVGDQAHAAVPAPNGDYVVVANQNGKLLQRIRTDYANNRFALEDLATLDLVRCTTPSGAACQDAALRPDNAPICPVIEPDGRFAFVTLRGGGLLVVDATATPMAVVAEYDRTTVAPNGCGGATIGNRLYINAGGGTAATPLRSELYQFPIGPFPIMAGSANTPAPAHIFSQSGRVDSHGAVAVPGAMLWVADRAANKVVVVDAILSRVVNEFSLAGTLSDDPAPDLMDIAPTGDWVFIALRGPNPLTANVPAVNNAVGSTPGVMVVRITAGGMSGEVARIARISTIVQGMEAADPHGIGVRRK